VGLVATKNVLINLELDFDAMNILRILESSLASLFVVLLEIN